MFYSTNVTLTRCQGEDGNGGAPDDSVRKTESMAQARQGGWQGLSGLMLRTSQVLSHRLSLNPQVAFQGRHKHPYITDEKTSVCVESRLKVAFSYLSSESPHLLFLSRQLRNNTWLLKKDLESFSNLVL